MSKSASYPGRLPSSTFWYPFRGLAFVLSRPSAFRKFFRAAVVYAVASAATLALCFSLLFVPQYNLLTRLLGSTWLAVQLASGAVLAEASWPLFLLLQYRQSDLSNSLFRDTLREVGAGDPAVLPPDEREELRNAGQARRQQRAAALTSTAAPITAPAQVLRDLFVGRPGDGRLRSWVRLTLTGPLLLFWPYGPVAYAWLNGYATGVGHHVTYFQAKGVRDREEQETVAMAKAGQYRRFGAAALLLSLVPVAGWGLGLVSAAGAALWAADLEGAGGRTPSKLYQGPNKTKEGAEYGLVAMEEGR